MSRIITILVLLTVIIAGLALHLRNAQPVILDFYLDSIEMPLSLAVVGALFCGALLGMLASLPLLVKLKHENNKLVKRARLHEKELNNLRVIPLKDGK